MPMCVFLMTSCVCIEGATHGGCFFDNATQIAHIRASYTLYRKMVQKLNGCGIMPILATFSTMEVRILYSFYLFIFFQSFFFILSKIAVVRGCTVLFVGFAYLVCNPNRRWNATYTSKASIGGGIDPTNPCVVWEDELVTALDGLQWARFYEQWPDQFHMRDQWYPNAKEGDRFAQIIANGILEAKAGIPVVAHVTPHNNSCEEGSTSNYNTLNNTVAANSGNVDNADSSNVNSWVPTGMDGFQMAAFYIAQGPGWVWSASGGWTDGSYCWRKEYNLQCGHPFGDATRTGPYTWTRNFTNCDVYVNTNCNTKSGCAEASAAASQGLYGEIRLIRLK